MKPTSITRAATSCRTYASGTIECVGEPHRQTRHDENERGSGNGPKVDLLASVEKVDVVGYERLPVRDVVLRMADPLWIGVGPPHRVPPVEDLQCKDHDKPQTEPRVEQPRHGAASKQRRQPMKEPRAVDREPGQKRQDEERRGAPVDEPGRRGMPEQFALVNPRDAESSRIQSLDGAVHRSSLGGAGCDSFGPAVT